MIQKLFMSMTVLLATTFAGCASTLLSHDRIQSETAGVLGLTPDQVRIENRRSETTNTYYVARTRSGVEYACIINGGTVLSAGLVNPPMCSKKGEPQKTNPFSR